MGAEDFFLARLCNMKEKIIIIAFSQIFNEFLNRGGIYIETVTGSFGKA